MGNTKVQCWRGVSGSFDRRGACRLGLFGARSRQSEHAEIAGMDRDFICSFAVGMAGMVVNFIDLRIRNNYRLKALKIKKRPATWRDICGLFAPEVSEVISLRAPDRYDCRRDRSRQAAKPLHGGLSMGGGMQAELAVTGCSDFASTIEFGGPLPGSAELNGVLSAGRGENSREKSGCERRGTCRFPSASASPSQNRQAARTPLA